MEILKSIGNFSKARANFTELLKQKVFLTNMSGITFTDGSFVGNHVLLSINCLC